MSEASQKLVSCDKISYRVNRPLYNFINFRMIYPVERTAEALRIIEEKSQKRLERQECVSNGQIHRKNIRCLKKRKKESPVSGTFN